MKLTMIPPARQEMLREAQWYDKREAGLGDRFLDELGEAFAFIMAMPNASEEIRPLYRRKLTTTFPYGVIDWIDADTILVVAVSHLKRRPGYWVRRVKA